MFRWILLSPSSEQRSVCLQNRAAQPCLQTSSRLHDVTQLFYPEYEGNPLLLSICKHLPDQRASVSEGGYHSIHSSEPITCWHSGIGFHSEYGCMSTLSVNGCVRRGVCNVHISTQGVPTNRDLRKIQIISKCCSPVAKLAVKKKFKKVLLVTALSGLHTNSVEWQEDRGQ